MTDSDILNPDDLKAFDFQIQRFNIFAYYNDIQIFDYEGAAWQGYANNIVQTPVYEANRAPPPFPEPDNLSFREMYAQGS